MNIHMLGTCAAEGIPALFCRCALCMKARELGGKNIRTRSSVLIDEVLKVDFPPDTYHHLLRDGLDLCKVKDLFFTHSHIDHLIPGDFVARLSGYSHGCDGPLNVYANETVIRKIRNQIGNPSEIPMRLLRPFVTVEAETATVTPLLADHDPEETCFIFHIERNGKRLLYGHDTGWFPDASWEWLKGRRLDAVILDTTNGMLPGRRNHMNIEAVIETRDRLLDQAIIGTDTPVVATHFSHFIGLLHEDLEAILAPRGIITAYDGMRLRL